MHEYAKTQRAADSVPPRLPLLMTIDQLVAWSGLTPKRVVVGICSRAMVSTPANGQAVGRAFCIDPGVFVDFWRTEMNCPRQLVFKSVEMQALGIASELQSQDAGALKVIEGIAEQMSRGFVVEPIKLMSVPGEQHRLIDGRKRCCAAWKCGIAALPACIVPSSPVVTAWLDLQSVRGRRALHERPVEYVCRIFDALPEFEEAVACGAISYRQVRSDLGLESHLPVFRAIKKRRQVREPDSPDGVLSTGNGLADFGQLRAAINSWSRLCGKNGKAFGDSHHEALVRLHQAAAVLLDAR